MPITTTKIAVLTLALAVSAPAAQAAVVFEAVSRAEVAQAAKPSTSRLGALASSKVRGWADGERGKVQVLKSRNPASPEGALLLSTDGTKTIRLFDTSEKTCRFWKAEGSGAAADVASESIHVEKTLDEEGGRVAGLATRHRRFAITYEVGKGPRALHGERSEDFWTAGALTDAGLGIWLATAARTGSAELDARIASAIGSDAGVALKRISTFKAAADGQSARAVTTTTEVTSLTRKKTLAASTFAEPFPCKAQTVEERR